MLRIALLALLLAHISAGAESLRLDALPTAHCDSEPVPDGYYDAKTSECVLGFSKELGSLVVSINGKLIPLIAETSKVTKRIKSLQIPSLGTREVTQFTSPNSAIKVLLDIEVVDSSCTMETESCCGDDYSGVIDIRLGKSRITRAIKHYSGG